MFNQRTVFLDRDGTLVEAIHRPDGPKKITCPFTEEELKFVPHVNEALSILKDAGFLRIMITNQPDVANGYMTEDEWSKIHLTVINDLDLDDYFMCRHRAQDNCPFKKPSHLMLLAAADKWGIDLADSYMVGDTEQDMIAGKLAGCATILIDAFYNQKTQCDMRVPDLMTAVRAITFADNL